MSNEKASAAADAVSPVGAVFRQEATEYLAAAEKYYQRDQNADADSAAAIAQVFATLALVEAVAGLADRLGSAVSA